MYARGMRGLGEGGDWCGSWPWEYLCSDAANKAANVKPIPRSTAGDIRDRSDATLWLCAFLPSDSAYCRVPSTGEIAAGQTDAGASLSPEARARATEMAAGIVASDCEMNPGRYTEIPGSCSYRGDTDFTTVALVVAAVAAFMLVKH